MLYYFDCLASCEEEEIVLNSFETILLHHSIFW